MPITNLPTTPTPAQVSPYAFSVYLYGDPKTGKSTWAAQNPKTLFLATEQGLSGLATMNIPIACWQDLLDALALLTQQGNKLHESYTAVAIDTVDIAWDLCTEHIINRWNATNNKQISHPSDIDYGKVYGLIKDEFRAFITKMNNLPCQLILVGHCKFRDKTRTTPARYVPSMPAAAEDIVCGMVDMILFVEARREGSVLHTQSSVSFRAGGRAGGMPPQLPMDYHAYMSALHQALKASAGAPVPPPVNNDQTPEQLDEPLSEDKSESVGGLEAKLEETRAKHGGSGTDPF